MSEGGQKSRLDGKIEETQKERRQILGEDGKIKGKRENQGMME